MSDGPERPTPRALRAFYLLDGLALAALALLGLLHPPSQTLAVVGVILAGGLLVLVAQAAYVLRHAPRAVTPPTRDPDDGRG